MPIRIFAHLTDDLATAGQQAREIEALGFDGVLSHESAHDPFFPLLLAAARSQRLHLMTDVAIAFARTPMTLANLAHDLNAFSGGRFVLGLGSQIKPHVTRRFSMPWSHPAARMRELIEAIRAIFATWYDGAPLRFEGQFYTHTLMTPAFTPTNTKHGKPPIGIAAVGPLMTETAGAVADRLFVHPFTTEAYLRQATLPHLRKGLDSTGRDPGACQLVYDPMIITGTNEAQFAAARKALADRIAFYASTPAYKPVLDAHGWGALQPELQAMTKSGRWSEMGSLVTDEMLRTFTVMGEVKDIAPQIWSRYGDLVADFGLASSVVGRETLAQIAADLRAKAASG